MKAGLPLLKIFNVLLLLSVWAYTMYSFNSLPETIPTHFGIDNKADAFSSKNTVFLLPAIATVLFVLLKYLSKQPDSPLLNVPETMRKDPLKIEFFIIIMQFFIVLIFANLTFEVFQVSYKGADEISNNTLYILGVMLLFILGMVLTSNSKIASKS